MFYLLLILYGGTIKTISLLFKNVHPFTHSFYRACYEAKWKSVCFIETIAERPWKKKYSDRNKIEWTILRPITSTTTTTTTSTTTNTTSTTTTTTPTTDESQKVLNPGTFILFMSLSEYNLLLHWFLNQLSPTWYFHVAFLLPTCCIVALFLPVFLLLLLLYKVINSIDTDADMYANWGEKLREKAYELLSGPPASSNTDSTAPLSKEEEKAREKEREKESLVLLQVAAGIISSIYILHFIIIKLVHFCV